MTLETIGYTEPDAQSRIEAFLAQDRARHILMDIRYSPRSRWLPQYNRSALYNRYGVQYAHCSVLGNLNYRPEDRAKGIEIADPEQGIARVVNLLKNDCSLMLLCACKDYEQCHRKIVYELIMQEIAAREEKRRIEREVA